MAKKIFSSIFLGIVICGVSFYLGYFVALIGAAALGPLNPANAPALQVWLRHVMLPVSLAVGAVVAMASFRRLNTREPMKPDNLLHFQPARRSTDGGWEGSSQVPNRLD